MSRDTSEMLKETSGDMSDVCLCSAGAGNKRSQVNGCRNDKGTQGLPSGSCEDRPNAIVESIKKNKAKPK